MSKTGRLVLAILFAAGAVTALGKVFFWGESVTNYGSYTPWGLWVALYIFLVGTAAGAAFTGIYAAWSSGGQPNRLTTLSFIVAGLSLGFGLAFIGMDLGKPLKGILIFLSPSFSSKLAVASWTYMLFFASLAGYFYACWKNGSLKTIFMYLAGIFAVGFVLAEGMFFGGMVARTAWNSWTTVAGFLTSSVAAGSALVYLSGLLFQNDVIAEEGMDIKKLLIIGVAAHVGVEAIHALGHLQEAAAMWGSISGLLFVVAGVIAPLYLLLNKNADRMSPIAPALMFFGLAAYKYSFMRSGFTAEPLPNLSDAFHHARLTLDYFPSMVEWTIAVGFVAGLLLAISIAVPKLMTELK